MDHTSINLHATGAFLCVSPEHTAAYGLAAQLITFLQPPLGAPFATEITRLLSTSLSYMIDRLEGPSAAAILLKTNFVELIAVMGSAQQDFKISSSHLSLRGKASTNPIWYQLAVAADKSSHSKPLLLYVGASVLLSFHHNKAIPRGAAQHIPQTAEVELSDASLDALISGFAPQELLGLGWTSRLAKMWRDVVKLYSSGDVPPPTLHSRVTGQLLGAALNPAPAHAAGAQSHSQLSNRQFTDAAAHVKGWSHRDELAGLLGILVIRTGLSVDVLAQIPLESGGPPRSGMHLDPCRGIVCIDLQSLAFEPAQPLSGCEIGGFNLKIHLPTNMADHLRNRSQRLPSAACLMDLYPGEDDVLTKESVFASVEEINPSWARFRRTAGPVLLHMGFHALHAALLSLDFSLICRSKLHYAVVSAAEWHAAEVSLYKLLNWDSPVEAAKDEQGIGSRVVPSDLTVVQHDTALLQALQAFHPGKHSTLERLIEFHNRFTLLTGWRISVLLAMRASSELALSASTGGGSSWVPVHDKSTRTDHGHHEPPRILRRLQLLRRWSHEQVTEVLPGSPRARCAHGAGASSRLPVAVGSD